MIDKSRLMRDCGAAMDDVLFLDDICNPLHLRKTIRLDHNIDGDLLCEAWKRTKRVYPVIDCVLEFDEGDASLYRDPAWREQHRTDHMYLVTGAEGEGNPIRSKVALSPNTEAVDRRLICVTYYEDTICLSAYHMLIDGGGFMMVASTLLYLYLALYTGHADEHPIVELREGRSLDEYYVPVEPTELFLQGYNAVPIFELPSGVNGFLDSDMRNDEGTIRAGTLKIDARDFMRLCKSNGANPSAMIAALLAKAAYNLNPDEQESVVFAFTVSARPALGMQESIANAATGAISYATRQDIEHKSLAEVAQRIRSDLNVQRTRDYTISFIKHTRVDGGGIPGSTRIVTYMGSFAIGDNTKHIAEIDISTEGDTKLFLLQLNDHFVLKLHYGRATQRYLDEFVRVFTELGIQVEVTYQADLAVLDAEVPEI